MAGGWESEWGSRSAEFFAKDLPIPYRNFTCSWKNYQHHPEKRDTDGRGIHAWGSTGSWPFDGNFFDHAKGYF